MDSPKWNDLDDAIALKTVADIPEEDQIELAYIAANASKLRVRVAAVNRIHNQQILYNMANMGGSLSHASAIRILAACQLYDRSLLQKLASFAADVSVRNQAEKNLAEIEGGKQLAAPMGISGLAPTDVRRRVWEELKIVDWHGLADAHTHLPTIPNIGREPSAKDVVSLPASQVNELYTVAITARSELDATVAITKIRDNYVLAVVAANRKV